ncbi:cytidine(C)-cytidine(C)-adenosine (A)]-adding enzyme [Acidocella aquatica]|uniref:Cytidine(C)-cytidine(C)-adenosine (A)]-adding enzyme n=1 Tax=Acidocella aquatica TaxID=1922313 RepID=A0ABQ6A6V2_9PROT|nr:CCA tRNA nucleotidyltransferase [Acidocella aquatica]GLR67586.1 cytidine(C)-cytidine(C)-adenosine (A)]-adding enzyme [Acidocella aquatica]
MIDLPGMAALWDALPQARMVGGAVRDMLAGREVADVDFAVPLSPQEVIARVRAAGLKAVPTGLAHGTVTVVACGRGFEVTSLRRDVATDGRHAVVEFTDDWEMDASRRDFTINAMSATRDGAVFDYFGGREDLAAGRVRFVGEAGRRIAEDYLRILRFFRFFARYGRGAPDAQAVAAIVALREGVRSLSAERVWSEVKQILRADDPRAVVALMRETGVLELVLPQADEARLAGMVARGAPVDELLRVAALLRGDAGLFAQRWRLSGAEQVRLAALMVPDALAPDADDAALRRALAEVPGEILIGRSWLGQDDRLGWDDLRARIAAMARPVFPVQGRDVVALGVPPGPGVGEVLDAVRRWWMAGGCVADARACLGRARAALDGDRLRFAQPGGPKA